MANIEYKKLYDLNAWSFKILKIFPGLITLLLLTSPIWATLLGVPQLVLYYITFLTVYWLFKSVTATAGNFIAYSRMKESLKIDWNAEIEKLSWKQDLSTDYLPETYKDFYHMVIIPFYKEDYEVLHETVLALANSEYNCKEKVFLVLCVEERGGELAKQNAERLVAAFADRFRSVKFYVHPQDIPGEVKGIAGANLRYAARSFVDEIRKEGYKLEDFLVTKFDSDLKVHPKYLSSLTYKYLVTPDRYHTFISPALMLYSNNYWDVPIMMRVIAGSLTLALLSEWVTAKSTKQSFSCYSFNLHLLDKIDYWDPQIGVDDTSFFWNAYLHLNGRFRGEEVYIPTYSDAVHAGTTLKSHVAQYKQLHRWGWGVIVFPMTLQGLMRNRAIPIIEKIGSVANLFQAYNMVVTTAFLLTFGIPLISLINPDFGLLGIAHMLPRVISFMLTFALIGLFPSRFILEKLYGPPPKEKGKLFFIWHYFEQLVLTITMLTFNFLPYIQAQFEMMLGREKKDHMVTPKMRAN
jgi:cellulose synthase/poly-beta-1,6-N-acetylglucosamine synthase-like glycosyltransferase